MGSDDHLVARRREDTERAMRSAPCPNSGHDARRAAIYEGTLGTVPKGTIGLPLTKLYHLGTQVVVAGGGAPVPVPVGTAVL